MKRLIAALALVVAFVYTGSAQQQRMESMANYIFSQDSLQGFDEPAASAGAMAENFFGREYKVFMYYAKRTYVNQKYGIKPAKQVTLFQNSPAARPSAANAGACNNEDFELAAGGGNIVAPGAVQGWTIQSGTNGNSCNAPTLTAVDYYTVFTTPTVDDRLPFQVTSYFDAGNFLTPSGSCYMRLNDDSRGAKAVRMSKSFIPSATSALFQYAYIAVIEDGSHGCCQQAGFNIKVTVTNTVTNTSTLLACPQISIAVPGAACQFTIPPGGPVFSPCTGTNGVNWSYANWTTSALDLTQYIGNMIQIDVTVVDCNAGGHGAYFYFDAKCSPMVVTGNGTPFAAGSTSVTVPTCGATGATMCATPGLGPYSWAGPGVPPNYSVPSLTNTCFTSSLSATYTLYMEPPGSCAPIARIINTTITPAPLLLANIVQASCGGTAAVITLTPSGSATNPSSITWSPTPLTISSTTTVANYTVPPLGYTNVVSVTAKDPLGCSITTTLNVLPPAPYPTFSIMNATGSPSITCYHDTISLNIQTTYTYGTLSYFWSNNTSTFATTQASIVTPGNYTILATDPATQCQATLLVPIGINTVAPSSIVSPNLQNLTCNSSGAITVSATAIPSVNVTHNILSPYGGSVSATSHTLVYVPSCGIYTHVLVNDINGCVTTKLFTVNCSQGFPTFNLQSPQNFTLGCTSKSCAVINIVNGNTDPGGGPVSYSILLPSSTSSVTIPGPLLSQSSYTVCGPGIYTVVTKDNTTFCETRIPISILSNTFTPNLSAIVDRKVLDCNNPKVVLRGQSTNPDAEFLWNFVGTPGFLQGDTIVAITDLSSPTKTVVNTYTMTVTDLNNTCKSATIIPIYQNLFKPNASITNGGLSALTCKTPTIVLTNQSTTSIPPATGFPANLPAVASWDGPTPQVPSENATTYTAQTVGIYTATVKDLNNGCTSVTTLTITDNKVYPDLNNTPKTPSVLDCGAKTIAVSPVLSNSSANLTYSWTTVASATITGAGTKTLTTNLPGEYAVLVTNTLNGCAARKTIEVVNGKLTADFDADKTQGYAPFKVTFTNKSSSTTGNENIASIWNFANSSSETFTSVQSASTTYFQPGTYTVTLYATKGSCMESAQKVISVDIPSKMEIPNVFTPNGDGVNDFFFLRSSNLAVIDAKIIDRWGHVVYEVSSAEGNITWDGKNPAGKEVAAGTYFYIIKATGKDGQEYNAKGTVNIYR